MSLQLARTGLTRQLEKRKAPPARRVGGFCVCSPWDWWRHSRLPAAASSNEERRRPGATAEVGKTSDINPQDPATLRQGGNLRLSLTEYPSNFNSLHIDGNVADAGAMLRTTMPRAFRVGSDGSTTVNTDYFTNVELTSESPQVVTYTINPKAVWSDDAPITWEDIKSQIDSTRGVNKAFHDCQPQRQRPRSKV